MKLYDKTAIMDTIHKIGIPFKEENGQAKLEYCPFCETGKTLNGSDMYRHFHISLETGAYYCWHRSSCGASGGYYSLQERLGLTPLGDGKRRNFVMPPKKEDTYIVTPEEKFYAYYEGQRGISKEIARKYNIEFIKTQNGLHYVYNFYEHIDGKKELFNRKYRGADNKKSMWTERNCKTNFYGMQFLDYNTRFIVVCEGEDDCHALAQYNVANVVSVPFGANTFTPEMMDVLDNFQVIYLAMDNDEAGEHGARRIAEKVGLNRCYRVVLPKKDARECLSKGIEESVIKEAIGTAEQLSHESISRVRENDGDELWDFVNGKGHGESVFTPHQPFNAILRGVRLGELTVLTGTTGSGKSTFGDNILHWIEQQGHNVMAFKFENKPISTKAKMVSIRSGRELSTFDETINKTVPLVTREWLNEQVASIAKSGWHFFTTQQDDNGYCSIEKLKEAILYIHRFSDCRYFLIDHLHYFLKTSGSSNATAIIDEAVREIRQFTIKLNVHIILVVHPAKTGADKDGKQYKPGLDSPKGSSSIAQECDNFITVDKLQNGYSTTDILKHREFGKVGKCFWQLDAGYNRFFECYKDNPISEGDGTPPPTF
jgi:twinkle protein